MSAIRVSLLPSPLARPALLSLVLTLFCGCATYRLGAPPEDEDLKNDGSQVAQDRLYDEYQVRYDGSAFIRPNATVEVDGNRRIIPRAAPESDQARNYLMTSPAAATIYDGSLLWVHRVLGTPLPYLVVDGTLVGGGMVVGAATGAALAASTGDVQGIASGAVCGGVAGLFVGLIAASTCSGVGNQIARPIAGTIAQRQYREAATAFNRDLRSRIEQGAGEPSDSHVPVELPPRVAPDDDREPPPDPIDTPLPQAF